RCELVQHFLNHLALPQRNRNRTSGCRTRCLYQCFHTFTTEDYDTINLDLQQAQLTPEPAEHIDEGFLPGGVRHGLLRLPLAHGAESSPKEAALQSQSIAAAPIRASRSRHIRAAQSAKNPGEGNRPSVRPSR